MKTCNTCGETKPLTGFYPRYAKCKKCRNKTVHRCGEHSPQLFIGQRCGHWTLLERSPHPRREDAFWLCRCHCGTVKSVSAWSLRSGASKSCYSCNAKRNQERVLIDLTGQRFGHYLVLSFAGDHRWNCVCDCGNHQTLKSDTLRSGEAQSCGCYLSTRSGKLLKDMTGYVNGVLTVVRRVPDAAHGDGRHWSPFLAKVKSFVFFDALF
jgi:hypothetical protein